MYATIERRTVNHARLQETGERAERDFFPTLRRADGFVDFHVIADATGENEAVTYWETRAQAEAFQPELDPWLRTLEELGHRLRSTGGGDIVFHVSPAEWGRPATVGGGAAR
jgi:hypothetical protein